MYANTYVVANTCSVGFFVLAPNATAVQTVRHALGRAVVAGRNDPILSHDDRAHLSAQAIRLLADGHGNCHIVLVAIHSQPPPLMRLTNRLLSVVRRAWRIKPVGLNRRPFTAMGILGWSGPARKR